MTINVTMNATNPQRKTTSDSRASIHVPTCTPINIPTVIKSAGIHAILPTEA
nr:hypothetical protein [Actinomyces sp. ph3]